MPQKTDIYFSIAAKSEGLYKELGSRFISFAFPVCTEEQVKEIVDSIKKEYHDARHHCYAYRLGLDGSRFRANDDGEPSSSAGKPILGQIDSAALSDILIVVVRYFGGIKLGVPGLIRAYRTAAADALSKAEKVEKTACECLRVSFNYDNMPQVMKALKDMSLQPLSRVFDTRCEILLEVRLTLLDAFRERISLCGAEIIGE